MARQSPRQASRSGLRWRRSGTGRALPWITNGSSGTTTSSCDRSVWPTEHGSSQVSRTPLGSPSKNWCRPRRDDTYAPELAAHLSMITATNQLLGGQMKRAWTLAAVAVAVGLTTAVVFADQEQSSGVIFARSRTVKYSPLVPGVSSSVAWGDTAKGPFGGFTKFRPGFDAGMHTHTADVLVVVLRGAYLYRDDAGAKRVGPGDFMRIPGGHKHWSGGDRKEGALFYQETFGKFGLIPVKYGSLGVR